MVTVFSALTIVIGISGGLIHPSIAQNLAYFNHTSNDLSFEPENRLVDSKRNVRVTGSWGTLSAPALVQSAAATFSEQLNPTGDPIGGYAGYSSIITGCGGSSRCTVVDGSYSPSSFKSLVENARSGDIIYIEETTHLHFPKSFESNLPIDVPAGVTIASNRGHNGAPGGKLSTDADFGYNEIQPYRSFLRLTGPNSRVTGLRIEGPGGLSGDPVVTIAMITDDPASPNGVRNEVDNNELWHCGGVCVLSARGKQIHIHHNFIHSTTTNGFSYGTFISTDNITRDLTGTDVPLIEANLYYDLRHAIDAGGGRWGDVDIRHNIFLDESTNRGLVKHHGNGQGHGYDTYIYRNLFWGSPSGNPQDADIDTERGNLGPQGTFEVRENWTVWDVIDGGDNQGFFPDRNYWLKEGNYKLPISGNSLGGAFLSFIPTLNLSADRTNCSTPCTVTIQANASDPEGHALDAFWWILDDETFKWTSSNTLQQTFTSAGTYRIYGRARNQKGLLSRRQSITINVTKGSGNNQAPTIIQNLPDMNGTAGDNDVTYNLNNYFRDPDGGNLSYSLQGGPYSCVSLSGSSNSTLNVRRSMSCNETVRIRATDASSSYVEDVFQVNISASDGGVSRNQAPVITQNIPDVNRTAGDADVTYNLNNYFRDPDGDNLTYSLRGGPYSCVTLSNNNLRVNCSASCTESVRIRATDPDASYVEEVIQVTINASSGGGSGNDGGHANTLAEGLASFWELEEQSGTRRDAHGGITLNATSSIGRTSGVSSGTYAADFAGSGSLNLSNAGAASLQMGTGDLALSLWVRFDKLPAAQSWVHLLDFGAGGGGEQGYNLVFRQRDGGRFYAYFESNSMTTSAMTQQRVSAGEWYHIVVNFDRDGKIAMFVNGTPGGSIDISGEKGKNIQSRVNFLLGQRYYPAPDGQIDQVGIWKRTLAESEIDYLYNGGKGRQYSELGGGSNQNSAPSSTVAGLTFSKSAPQVLQATWNSQLVSGRDVERFEYRINGGDIQTLEATATKVDLNIASYKPGDKVQFEIRAVDSSNNTSDWYVGTIEIDDPEVLEQRIYLEKGWNMISRYVDPDSISMVKILADLRSKIVVVKSESGQVYNPESGINQIGDWDPAESYNIYMSSPDTLIIKGRAIKPDMVPISLEAGWNYIPVISSGAISIEDALAPIKSNLVMVKNEGGKIFYPGNGVNEIGMMQPGEGYRLYLNRAATLLFPSL